MNKLRLLLAAALLLAVLGPMGGALAQGSAEAPPGDDVKGKVVNKDKGPGNETLPNLLPREDVAAGVLPFTGSDLVLFVGVGLIAIVAGAAVVRRARVSRAGPDGSA